MRNSSGALALSITKAGSKQAYYLTRWMVDRDLSDQFARAYAYLRWTDDVVDVGATSRDQRIAFMERQLSIVDQLCRGERPPALEPQEQMVADLISTDRSKDPKLHSFIRNMLAIIDFDAHRKGRLIDQGELDWYTERVAISVTDGLQYFIGNGQRHPKGEDRLLAVKAAHISHLLRDMLPDVAEGYINIPREYLEVHGIGPDDIQSRPFRDWIRQRVMLARRHFAAGKRYFDRAEVLRSRVVAYWYCTRFEANLDAIEQDGFVLRESYGARRKLRTMLRIAWQGLELPATHILRRWRRTPQP